MRVTECGYGMPAIHIQQLAAITTGDMYSVCFDGFKIKLSVDLQQVLLLKYEKGMSDREIADVLGITPNYVRVLRSRARSQLRDRLAPDP